MADHPEGKASGYEAQGRIRRECPLYQSQASSEGFQQSDKAGSDSNVWEGVGKKQGCSMTTCKGWGGSKMSGFGTYGGAKKLA